MQKGMRKNVFALTLGPPLLLAVLLLGPNALSHHPDDFEPECSLPMPSPRSCVLGTLFASILRICGSTTLPYRCLTLLPPSESILFWQCITVSLPSMISVLPFQTPFQMHVCDHHLFPRAPSPGMHKKTGEGGLKRKVEGGLGVWLGAPSS